MIKGKNGHFILVIVESPAKCGKIESFLGSGYKCIASYGHLRYLPNLKYIDVENNYKPTFLETDSKEKQIDKLRYEIGRAKDVLLATDDDREGEAIAWHICDLFDLPIRTTKRIIFHEITKPAIVNAVSSPVTLNMDIVHAQQGRQILDLIVGYKLSPLLWKHISRNSNDGLSAGRCQTPALRLVYDNYKSIENSPGKKVYNTTGIFTSQNITFLLNKNYDEEEKMETFLEDSVSFDHKYICDKPRDTTKKPPVPFTTSSLQQSASNEMHISPKDTMAICQKLYEAGLITYMRTDSKIYSKEFIDLVKPFIKNKWDEMYIHPEVDLLSEKQEKKSKKKKKDDNAQEAHEAIRPTNIMVEEVPDQDMSAREKKLYKLIWKNTIQSCMSTATYKSITAKISAPDDSEYKPTTEKCIFPGWKIVDNSHESSDNYYEFLQMIKKNETMNYKKVNCKLALKELTNHYTEAKLVQLLEDKGIGRPSTFSSIVDKIQERGYVKKENIKGKKIDCVDFELDGDEISEIRDERVFGNEKNKLVIQNIGIIVLEFLLKYFEKIFDYEYTKNMENDLDHIAKGDKVWYDLCSKCDNELITLGGSLIGEKKESIKIDSDHEYLIGKYGPVIKCGSGDNITFKQVKENIDIEKLKRGEYKIDEITETISSTGKNLGKYKGNNLFLRKGKYGLYITCGDLKKSLSGIKINESEISLEDVIKFMEEAPKSETSNMIRVLDNNFSIRNGKYGHYIFYKTEKMSKPRFIKLAGFKHDYKTCDKDVLINWIKSNHVK